MASTSKITIENAIAPAPKGLDFEEATAGEIITMPPTLVRDDSSSPDLRVIVFKPTSPVPSLLGDLISVLFDHFNEFMITPTSPPPSSAFPGVTLLDSTADPDFASALGNDCHLKLEKFVTVRLDTILS
ncbi:hypothetical protein EYR40_010999 [Pleurotus pulmonarius]|nr:hypothetical protein EYR40_010999 [Pleurotus pulmonarius]